MKRILTLLVALTLLGTLCLSVSAETEEKNLVILGDSIATGHSLPDYNSSGNPKSLVSWSTLLAQTYGAKQYNLAVDGDTVGDFLKLAHLVGNIDDSDAVGRQTVHDAEKVLDLLLGERRRGLVQHDYL